MELVNLDDMRSSSQLTDDAVLAELGRRLERRRIEASLTQARLAQEAGVSKRTLERVESGAGCELITLIRILRVLKLIEQLDAMVPELPLSPIALLKLQGRQRQRVGTPRRRVHAPNPSDSLPAGELAKEPPPSDSKWKWGE